MTRPASSSAALPTLAELMHGFRSLGGNCEFGFVQRYCGVEPSGLLRFAYTPLDDLIRALDTDFEGYGAPGDLSIEETKTGAYYCRSRCYGIWWNTMQLVGSIDPVALLEREYGRVGHLCRKMLAELADGSKIFVRTASHGEREADFMRLAEAVSRHGPSCLLRVTATGSNWKPQPVRRIGERLFEGHVPRFSLEQAWVVDLEPWIALCNSVYAAWHDMEAEALDPGHGPQAMLLSRKLQLHRGKAGYSLTAYTRAVEPAAFDPSRTYVFSTWVWIPESCTASRIFAAVGQDRLGWRDADMTTRRSWQRVWVTGRFRPSDVRAPVGLGMVGTESDTFWSFGARFQEGCIPAPSRPPGIVTEPAIARWMTRWRSTG